MFHVEHLCVVFSVAACLAAAETPPPGSAPPGLNEPPAPLNLPLATNSGIAKAETLAGMLDLMLGWEESALLHFRAAVNADAACLLPHVGLLLANLHADTRDKRDAFAQSLKRAPAATPAESFYLNAFLKLLSRDVPGAAEDFCARSDRYRADVFSACWGILLLHCIDYGYTPEGKPEPFQQRALERADALYHACQNNALACFVRGYVEESAPVVSAEALDAARKAAKLLPCHPATEHLLGHLLYRSGKAQEAVPHFRRAAELAQRDDISYADSVLLMTARLYESTALWSSWQDAAALRTRRAMNAVPLDRARLSRQAVLLQRWEASTLPLRILVKRSAPPTYGEIAAASRAATPEPPLENDPALLVRDCLRSVAYVRMRHAAGDQAGSLRSLQLAEEACRRFKATRDKTVAQGLQFITPWMRAEEACEIALSVARAEVYESTAELWKQAERDAVRPVSLLMPPPIPERIGDKPVAKAASHTAKNMKAKGKRAKGAKAKAKSRNKMRK